MNPNGYHDDRHDTTPEGCVCFQPVLDRKFSMGGRCDCVYGREISRLREVIRAREGDIRELREEIDSLSRNVLFLRTMLLAASLSAGLLLLNSFVLN